MIIVMIIVIMTDDDYDYIIKPHEIAGMYMEVTYKNGNFMWLLILYSISYTILIIILLT